MTLEQLASMGEMIGGFSVVLTLLYLAFETRRNTTVHIASTNSDAYLDWAASNQAVASDPILIPIIARVYDNQPLDSFDLTERIRIELSMRSLFQYPGTGPGRGLRFRCIKYSAVRSENKLTASE